MHIVECYFESGGFDFRLLKGGISVYMWNLSRKFVAAGHRVSIITATNGKLDYLQQHYALTRVDYEHRYTLPLELDPQVWDNDGTVEIPINTSAYKMQLEGIDVYFLDNHMLKLFPDTCYPPYDLKGKDLGFYKPLAFQVDCIDFIRRHLGEQPLLIHAHEPYYQYLLPLAFKDDPDKIMVSTVQSNMPVNKKIYKPKLARLLAFLGVEADLDRYDDRLDAQDGLIACMEQQLPATHLYYPYGAQYVNLLAPILDYSDYVDFLSPGQLRFYASFAGTPFEQLFGQLTIAEVMQRNVHKCFVGWCAIADNWLRFDPSSVERAAVLRQLGLNPDWPTFYHNARYAVEHKGQVELMRAIDALLAQDSQVNFIVRCVSGSGIDNPYFHEVKARYPANIQLDWSMVSEQRLMEYASAADFSLFPSKFEMDTFLIAQGEAMLCGAVPIATAQEGTSHFEHALPLSDPGATGFAVNRSFAEDDGLLVQGLVRAMTQALAVYRADRPRYDALVANARTIASRFTWDMAAQAHLEVFERAEAERRAAPAAPEATLPAAPATSGFPRAQVSLRQEGGRTSVRAELSGAAGIELFARFAGKAQFRRLPMLASGDGFDAELPEAPSDTELYLRLTMNNGSVSWDRSRYA